MRENAVPREKPKAIECGLPGRRFTLKDKYLSALFHPAVGHIYLIDLFIKFFLYFDLNSIFYPGLLPGLTAIVFFKWSGKLSG